MPTMANIMPIHKELGIIDAVAVLPDVFMPDCNVSVNLDKKNSKYEKERDRDKERQRERERETNREIDKERAKEDIEKRKKERQTSTVQQITFRLPAASTCFNILLLPPYKTMELLKEKLVAAISFQYEGFGRK